MRNKEDIDFKNITNWFSLKGETVLGDKCKTYFCVQRDNVSQMDIVCIQRMYITANKNVPDGAQIIKRFSTHQVVIESFSIKIDTLKLIIGAIFSPHHYLPGYEIKKESVLGDGYAILNISVDYLNKKH